MVIQKKTVVRVVTGKVRFNYVNLFEPRESEEGYAPKYGICVLISKDDKDTINKINKAIEMVRENAGEFYKSRDIYIKIPLRDGDEEKADMPEFKECYFLNATTKYRPEVVDKNCIRITNPEEVYSGCYGRTSLSFYPYENEDGPGIGCWLNNVQKLEDGEALVTRISPEEDFKDDDILG